MKKDDYKNATKELWHNYDQVHGLVPPTRIETERATKKLYRFATGRTWPGEIKITTGRNRSYLQNNEDTIRVNGSQGWAALVADLAWSFTNAGWEGSRKDGKFQTAVSRLENKMANEVIARMWYLGVLKDKPREALSKTVVRTQKIAMLEKREIAWEKKRLRAEVALKKIRKSLVAYKRFEVQEC